MSLLVVQGLQKSFQPNFSKAVDDISFCLEVGSIATIVGPSGCGKTTTLRLIAGFENPDAGQLQLENKTLFGNRINCPPEQRGIGFVFQDYALFPHLSVLENVTFGLGQMRQAERLKRADEILGLVGLNIFRDRLPNQLSGGQQQRVALARALAPRPKLILLDEPFSSLDANLRASTRHEIRKILKSIGATALLVTHDQEEAMSFSDRIIVMRDGRIEQDDSPEKIYQAPRTAFVANFLGRTNLIVGQSHGSQIRTVLGTIQLEAATAHSPQVMLSVRPEHLRLTTPLEPLEDGLIGIVTAREYQGHQVMYTFETEQQSLIIRGKPEQQIEIGQPYRVTLAGKAVLVH
jgi:iron(III) transport system ATP-binding protein